jgi:hypothetical protein
MSRRALLLSIVSLTLATGVRADRPTPAAVVWAWFEAMATDPPDDLRDAVFAFDLDGVQGKLVPRGSLASVLDGGFGGDPRTVAFSANGEAAWLAADLATYQVCGDETCPKKPRVDERFHATALFVGGPPWQPVMFHLAAMQDGKAYAAAVEQSPLEAVPDRTGDTDDVVARFRTTIGDPAALAKTISPRADVVLYGTERKERFVGGKKVAATLAKWNLAFTVRDGLQAGTVAAGTVAWIAANVDAASKKRPGAAPMPYRLTAIYEMTRAGWKVVLLHFSYQR